MQLHLKQPFDYQHRIIHDPHKYKLTVCGRQVGKTETGGQCLILGNDYHPGALINPGTYLWVSPSYKQMTESALPMLRANLRGVASYQGKESTFNLINGSKIVIRSAEAGADSIRGMTVKGCIIDECAFVDQEVYTQGVLPALSVNRGFCYLFTTPNGFNWVYDLNQDTLTNQDWAHFSLPTWDCPLQNKEDIESKRAFQPLAHWRQEWLGEYVSSADALFNPDWFEGIFTPHMPEGFQRSVIAVDLSLGKLKSDYQAIVFAGYVNSLVYCEVLLLRTSVTELLDVIAGLYHRYNPEAVVIESNCFQVLATDEFKRRYDYIKVYEQVNVESKKTTRIMRLALPLSRRIVRILDNHHGRLLINQLRDFPSPDAHDDGPDALEMAIRYLANAE